MLAREDRLGRAKPKPMVDGVFSHWKGAIIVAPPGTGKTTFVRAHKGRTKVYDGDDIVAEIGPWTDGTRLPDDDRLRDAYAYTSVFVAAARVTKERCVVVTYPPPLVWPEGVRDRIYFVQPDADQLSERRTKRDGDGTVDDLPLYDKKSLRHYKTLEEAFAAAEAALAESK